MSTPHNDDWKVLRWLWPWSRCRHSCSCWGSILNHGHNAGCPRNPLHNSWFHWRGFRHA